MSHRTLIVLPDDTAKEIIDAINNAQKTILIKMFLFSDTVILNAVIAAKKRGVNVRVMLNPVRHDGEHENENTRKILEEAGIEVRDSNPEFTVTHEKSMVIDDKMAFIKSLNWETKNFTETRDYAIITYHSHEIKEIILCFEADWERKNFDPDENLSLIWCSNNGRTRIAKFIDEAKHTLFVQNERFQDVVIIERLVHAARRGVKVHVMARPPHTLKLSKLVEGVGGLRIMDDVGIKIHKLKFLRLHGKMLLADGCRAIIGSINLSPGSFDHRRELAIEVHDPPVIERMKEIAHYDWENSHPLDLSDQGLLEDLENMDKIGIEKLVIDEDIPNHNKKHHKHNK
ncbi:MAG TPA: phospholipase D-like domain-containing protein [Hanamia sp.]|nr:phospholipase D-like domain-containing protein [Hanamia sp.]